MRRAVSSRSRDMTLLADIYSMVEVALDQGAGSVVPTITIEDVDKAKTDSSAKDDAPAPPGAMPAGAAPPIPDWYKVGWRDFTPPDTSGEDQDASQARMMHSFISEQYYGDWYHNAALIVFVRLLLVVAVMSV